MDFTKTLVQHGMVTRELLEQRLEATSVDPNARIRISNRLQSDFERSPGDYAGT